MKGSSSINHEHTCVLMVVLIGPLTVNCDKYIWVAKL